jgi:hypothetical protein
MMESILGHGIDDISEIDKDSYSHWDEDGWLLTTISVQRQQLVGIRSDELPNFPWDSGTHLVSSFFHIMTVQVALVIIILHSLINLRGIVGICSMWRDRFSLLILVIEFGDGWEDFGSTGIPFQVELLDSKPNHHRYFSMRIQEWGIHYVYVW